ncbi:MAG: cysteine synthase family protein, partial [Prevotella sp.]|nr:cysteine synthase family protein [Prevotella sp.]
MTKIAKKLTELIGNTPLLELGKFSESKGLSTPIIAKVEFFNPGGSVKDRIAFAMIEDAEKKGILKPGATIIEPTSGNTGVGLALVSAVKGYHLILTMPETMSIERRNLVKAYGAEVRLTSGKDGMAGAIKAAEQLRDSIPGSIILQQFENPANPQRHYDTTGVELWEQTEGKIDIFVAGVGTGGTVSGIGKRL